MESVYLKTFVEVARTGNITRASETLCITQPAVSRRIKSLEDCFGKTLIDRSGSVLTLTEAGFLLLGKAKMMLELEQEMLCDLSSTEAVQGLSFVSTPSFGIAHLPEVLREFMIQYSEVSNLKFRIEMSSDIVEGLKAGIFDIAVIEHCKSLDLSGFDIFPLPGDDLIFAAAPSLNISPTPTIEELLSHTLFERHEACCTMSLLDSNLKTAGYGLSDFRRTVIISDFNHILQELIKGDGIAFISRDVVLEHLKRGELCEFRVADFIHQRQRTFVAGGRLPTGSPSEKFFQVLTRYNFGNTSGS